MLRTALFAAAAVVETTVFVRGDHSNHVHTRACAPCAVSR